MASGITHILLMKNLQNVLPEGKLKKILQSSRDFLQIGAVGPDLPYASILDDDLFFSVQSDLADKFHYEKTNQLILKAFHEIKSNSKTYTRREKRFLFSFFLGFASHIIADGIIHPFVRDKVGDYNENKSDHRKLEMQLDVLLFHHLTKNSNNPIELNYSEIHDELINFDNKKYPEVDGVLEMFSRLIKDVYGYDYKPNLIKSWINGLHKMFAVAEGDHPRIYNLFIESFIFADYNDLLKKYKDIIVLTKPKDRNQNFLKKRSINFFDDCLPQFYNRFIPLAEKCYNYIYQNQDELTSLDIPLIDLDTGRDLAFNDLDYVPILWSNMA